MASNQELFEIILNVTGRDKIDQAQKSIRDEEEAIRQLIAQLKAGAISQAQFDASSLKSAAAIKQAGQAIQSAGGKVNTQGLNQLAYAIDDLQSGFRGISNNIQPVLSGFAATAAYAAPIAILAIGINALVTNWDKLTGIFGGGHTKTQAEDMEELRKKTSLTADEAERLARATATSSKVKELQGGQTEAQKKQESDVTKAIVEAGSREVAAGVLRANPTLVDNQGDAAVAKEAADKAAASLQSAKDAAGSSEDINAIPAAENALLEANLALAKAREKVASELAANGSLAQLFPGGLKQLQGLVTANPEAFGVKGNQLRKDLTEAGKTPEDLEEEKAQSHLEEQERAYQNRLAQWQESTRVDEEQKDKDAAKHLADQEQEYRERLAAWQAQSTQKLQDENIDAGVKDVQAFDAKRHADHQRTSQVFDGAASLRDSIQSSIRIDKERDPTATEQLASTRAIEAYLKKISEQKVMAAARAG